MRHMKNVFRAMALVTLMAIVLGCAKQQTPPAETVVSDADLISAIAGRVWVAEYIHGLPVVDMSHTSMIFTTADSVNGSGACNAYSGSYALKDGAITFGPMAATMKMCPEAISDQEMRFFQSLDVDQTVSFENGLLHLTPAEGKPSIFAVQE